MKQHTSGRLALAVSVLALVVALGGTSYAAIKIGTKQLKNNAVISSKIKDDSVSGADVKESTLAKVPSAATADAATSATSATNATNATQVGGLTFIKVNYISNTATPTILAQLAGLTVTATCSGNDLVLSATTTKQDSSFYSDLMDLEDGNSHFVTELESGSFDTSSTANMTGSAPEPNEDPALIRFAFHALDGSIVSGNLSTDDNAGPSSSGCMVGGTVVGG